MAYRRTIAISSRIAFAVVVTLMEASHPTSGATAQDGAGRTLTIYTAECPVGYAGDASADECDDNPIAGVPFTVGRPNSDAFYEYVPTDAGGLVAFEFDGLPGDGILSIIEQAPGDTERFAVYCVDSTGAPLGITYKDYSESSPDIGAVDVVVGSQGDVACDWYNVPRSARTVEATRAPVTGTRTVTPTVAELQTRVAEQAATIEALETAVARSTVVAVAESAEDYPSSPALQSAVMAGWLGDVWELNLRDDSYWWQAVGFGWTDTPSPRYVARPQGVWMVVSIDLGTLDSWIYSDFPYDIFALEDHLGNIYYPDLTATDIYCDSYCDMDIVQQDFSGWVGHTFHQAVVFDVPAPGEGFSGDEPGFTLRTLDGMIAVPLRR